jgi:hypothetical protein
MLIGVKVQDLHAQHPDSMYGGCCAFAYNEEIWERPTSWWVIPHLIVRNVF